MHKLVPKNKNGGKNKSHLTLKETILPQPPSFGKKKNYEVKTKLGEGTFGKVMVRLFAILISILRSLRPSDRTSARHGTSRRSRRWSPSAARP